MPTTNPLEELVRTLREEKEQLSAVANRALRENEALKRGVLQELSVLREVLRPEPALLELEQIRRLLVAGGVLDKFAALDQGATAKRIAELFEWHTRLMVIAVDVLRSSKARGISKRQRDAYLNELSQRLPISAVQRGT